VVRSHTIVISQHLLLMVQLGVLAKKSPKEEKRVIEKEGWRELLHIKITMIADGWKTQSNATQRNAPHKNNWRSQWPWISRRSR
jgi:hypothetical protein